MPQVVILGSPQSSRKSQTKRLKRKPVRQRRWLSGLWGGGNERQRRWDKIGEKV